MKTYQLRCIAPDGAMVREGEFLSVESAWNRAEDMGSRWFFYPLSVVTGASRSDLARIISAPPGCDSLVGRSLRSVSREFADNSEAVAAWLNGETPFPL